MYKFNYFLVVSVWCITAHAMDVEPNRAAEEHIKRLMDLKNEHEIHWDSKNWQEVERLFNTCGTLVMGRALQYTITRDQDQHYRVWMWKLLAHLSASPDRLRANLKQFFTDPQFRLNDAAAHELLTSVGRDNFSDTIAISCVQYLLKKGVNVNCTDDDGCTPLMKYVSFNRVFLAEYLIMQGADAKMAAHFNNSFPPGVKTTPTLHFACSARMVQLLLTKGGVDKNIRDYRGNTLLHLFVDPSDTIHIPGLLIQHSADMNAQNNKGNTPLHLAVKKGNKDIIGLLTRCGADCRIKNNAGQLPRAEEVQEKDMTIMGMMHEKN